MKNKKNFKKNRFRGDEDDINIKGRRKRPKPPKNISKYGVYSLLDEEEDLYLDNDFEEDVDYRREQNS